MLKKEINLMSYEDILGETSQTKELPLTELYEFQKHPYQVREDNEFEELVQSIEEHGVLTPVVARERAEGGYELISGHRRKRACEKLGLKTMTVIVKELSDDEAAILVVDSNVQRRKVFTSEKAKAYALKYGAMRHQGRIGGSSLEAMGELLGENAKKIQRYIWLSRLKDELLEKVDTRQIPFVAGVELSFLSPGQQEIVMGAIDKTGCGRIDRQKALKLKDAANKNVLDEKTAEEILQMKTAVVRDISLDAKKLEGYFGKDFDQGRAVKLIFELLDKWKEEKGSRS